MIRGYRHGSFLHLPACGERVGVGEGGVPTSLSLWRRPLTRNERDERAQSDLSPKRGRGKPAS
jgi:hypothetical protein